MALSRPLNGKLIVKTRVPVLPGDEIYLLTPEMNAHQPLDSDTNMSFGLPWSIDPLTSQLVIDVSGSDLDSVDYAWAFQVRYRPYDQTLRGESHNYLK